MRTLVQLVALLLLALWLPVTSHCALAAAGVAFDSHGEAHGEHADHCGTTDGDCAEDVCEIVEGGGYGKSVSAGRVLPPALLGELCAQWLPLLQPALIQLGPPPANVPPAVRVLQRCWAFQRRTALPARAPGFVV